MIQKIKNFWAKYKIDIIIFCLGFGVRFLYAIFIQFFSGSHAFISYSDANTFLRQANNLLQHGSMSQMLAEPFTPDALRTPLYLYFLACLIWLKLPLLGMIAVQNIMAGVVCVLTYKIGKIVFNSKIIGIIAAVALSIEPISIYWNNLLMSDNLLVFLLIIAVYLFAIRKFKWFAMVMGLAVLARPVALYLFPLFLIMFVWQYRKQEKKFIFKKLLIVCFLFFIILFPWMLRDKILFNTWDISSAGWFNLYVFSFDKFAANNNLPLPMPPVLPAYQTTPYGWVFSNYDFANTPFYKSQISKIFFEKPIGYLKFHLSSVLKGINNHDYPYLMNYVIRIKLPQISAEMGNIIVKAAQGIWWVIYALIFMGFLKKKHRLWQLFLLSFFIVNMLLLGYSSITWGGRYNLPFVPLLLLAGSYGFWVSYNWICARLTALISRTRS